MDDTLLRTAESLGYRDPYVVVAAIKEVFQYFNGLLPKSDQRDGANRRLLSLCGHLPVPKLSRQIMLKVWLPLNFPSEPPSLYILVSRNMYINPRSCVDDNGKIQHEYLSGWDEFQHSNLADFLQDLVITFTEELPVYETSRFNQVSPSRLHEMLNQVLIYNPDMKLAWSSFDSDEGYTSEELCLEGKVCVPTEHKVNICVPVRIWMVKSFPVTPPIVYVYDIPREQLRRCATLYASGKVRHSYLTSWIYPGSSNLKDLLAVLITEFSKRPPINIPTEPRQSNISNNVQVRKSRPSMPIPTENEEEMPNIEDKKHNKGGKSPQKISGSRHSTSREKTHSSVVNPPLGVRKQSTDSHLDGLDNYLKLSGVSQGTVNTLLQNGFTTMKAVMCMQEEDLQSMNLPLGEFCLMRESLRRIKQEEYVNTSTKLAGGDESAQGGDINEVKEQTSDQVDPFLRALKNLLKEHTVTQGELVTGNVIGKGEYGVVHKGILQRRGSSTKLQVAIKTITLSNSSGTLIDDFIQEILHMRTFNHPNVMCLLALSMENNKPYMVLPYMAHGDLKKYISDANRVLTIEDLLKLAVNVASGMKYLGDQKFIHGDLAARNCLVDESCIVKVGDFGLSKQLHLSEYYRFDTCKTRPVRWMAPETLKDFKYTRKSDVWSYGILLWELMTRGVRPYYEISDTRVVIEMVQAGYKMKCPEYTPELVYDLMVRCWKLDQASRPDFTTIISWLSGFINDEGRDEDVNSSSSGSTHSVCSTGTGSASVGLHMRTTECNPPPPLPPRKSCHPASWVTDGPSPTMTFQRTSLYPPDITDEWHQDETIVKRPISTHEMMSEVPVCSTTAENAYARR